jgi:hypothetical protein
MLHINTPVHATATQWLVEAYTEDGANLAQITVRDAGGYRTLLALVLDVEGTTGLLEAAHRAMDLLERADDHPAMRRDA